MKLPKLTREEMRKNNVSVALSEAEKRALEKNAKSEGLSNSSYCRLVLSKVMKIPLGTFLKLMETVANEEYLSD